jgi:hypothetical protein
MISLARKFATLTAASTIGLAAMLAPMQVLRAAPPEGQPAGPPAMDRSGMPVSDHAMPGHDAMSPEMMRQHQQMMASMHGQGMHGGSLRMPGQDAFGAIQEIVRTLEADPATDWSKIDLEALRQHLIDMNDVTLNAVAVAKPVEGGVEITVTGGGRTLAAIQRMVPEHAKEIDGLNGWSARARTIENGVLLTVTSSDPKQVPHIRGLGFIGIMVSGSHHQAHHLAMAKGEFTHGH